MKGSALLPFMPGSTEAYEAEKARGEEGRNKKVTVKNGIIYASRVSGENKPAKLTVRCGKLKKVIEVNVTGK